MTATTPVCLSVCRGRLVSGHADCRISFDPLVALWRFLSLHELLHSQEGGEGFSESMAFCVVWSRWVGCVATYHLVAAVWLSWVRIGRIRMRRMDGRDKEYRCKTLM